MGIEAYVKAGYSQEDKDRFDELSKLCQDNYETAAKLIQHCRQQFIFNPDEIDSLLLIMGYSSEDFNSQPIAVRMAIRGLINLVAKAFLQDNLGSVWDKI